MFAEAYPGFKQTSKKGGFAAISNSQKSLIIVQSTPSYMFGKVLDMPLIYHCFESLTHFSLVLRFAQKVAICCRAKRESQPRVISPQTEEFLKNQMIGFYIKRIMTLFWCLYCEL